MSIYQYTKNKKRILAEVEEGEGPMSPYAVSEIIGVPMEYIENIGELNKLDKLDKLLKVDRYHISFEVNRATTVEGMEEYGVSNLSFVFHLLPQMLYFFMMDNGRAFRVKIGELRSRGGKNITENLLFLFDKLKIEELELLKEDDEPTSKFELMDFD